MFLCEMGVIISPGERQLENVCLRQKKKKKSCFLVLYTVRRSQHSVVLLFAFKEIKHLVEFLMHEALLNRNVYHRAADFV